MPDLFNDAVDGLWPSDYDWTLLSSVVKDGVTAFEVYLEKAANEVRKFHGLADLKGRRGFLNWGDLRDFYKDHLGLDIDTAEIKRIRKLRHLLTHSRGSFGPRPTGRRLATRARSSRRARRRCPRVK